MSDQSTKGRLHGKVSIVTGGGSGYGAGIAARFAEEGATVIITDINVAGGEKVASVKPGNIEFIKADVSQEADWQSLIDAVFKKHGQVDCLVNNAGTTYPNKPSLDVSISEFDRCFNVNVKSIFFSISTLLPRLIEAGKHASIINIASVGATRPRPGLVWYNASKAAVCNATKGLAAEFGPQGIRVNSVCPLLGGTGLYAFYSI